MSYLSLTSPTTLKILIPTIIGLGVYIETAGASIIVDQAPIAIVEVVHQEVEIEYVNPSIWSQWVFDTDTAEVEYINFE